MKKTELYGYVYNFSVNYDSIDAAAIWVIHKYLMKRHDIKKILGYIEKLFIELLSFCTIRSFCESLTFNSTGSTKYVSLNNKPCQARLILVNINSVIKFFFNHLLLVIIFY